MLDPVNVLSFSIVVDLVMGSDLDIVLDLFARRMLFVLLHFKALGLVADVVLDLNI